MKPILLLLLLLPVLASSQAPGTPVEPVVSKDYINLIRKNNSAKNNTRDSTNSVRNANLWLQGSFSIYFPIRKIDMTNGSVKFYPHYTRRIYIGGTYSSTIEIKTINRTPALQNEFAQGRSDNGVLKWRGPETGELFSYGPSIGSLEFDGSAYSYDINGKLVAKNTGNGIAAKAYSNSIFRTASLFSQSFTVRAGYIVNGLNKLNLTVNVGKTGEKTFIRQNKNNADNISASVNGLITKSLSLSGSYTYLYNTFSNGNRNGFLNRVYQNSILTPVSFDNTQGTLLGNIQRSYSNLTDNPFFLLENNGNSFSQTQNMANLSFEKKQGKFKFKITQSAAIAGQISNEGYKPATAYFENGIATQRKKDDHNYYLRANISHPFSYFGSEIESTASFNYIFTDANSTTRYSQPNNKYAYQRSSHDFAFDYISSIREDNVFAGINVGNKFYLSNTATRNNYFLPNVKAFLRIDRFFSDRLNFMVNFSFNRFTNELAIDKSYAHTTLVNFSTEQAFQYFPVREALSFNNLKAIDNRELTSSIEISYTNKVGLIADFFTRKIINDVFPVNENGNLLLKNIASHRKTGIELQLYSTSSLFNIANTAITNRISFITWQDKVTEVKDGYNFTPVAGFNNINKAIIKGETLGAITGNTFRRDANNNLIIGADGYPLVNNQRSVIGNPIPDFVMKMNNAIAWKRWYLNMDWQWEKGGQIWNGTQAALDYYGRSENSSILRNTTGYIFPGVSEDGHVNTIPVRFYDPALPLDQNRWTRYGISGVAEEYIQKADRVKLNTLSVGYKFQFRKNVQKLTIAAYINNLILWTAYKGADPNQLLYDQPDTSGLDFFNLPSTKTIGLFISLQF